MISYFFCSTGPIMFVVYAAYEIFLCATGKSNLGMVKARMRRIKEGRAEEQTKEEAGETETEKEKEEQQPLTEKEKLVLAMKESVI